MLSVSKALSFMKLIAPLVIFSFILHKRIRLLYTTYSSKYVAHNLDKKSKYALKNFSKVFRLNHYFAFNRATNVETAFVFDVFTCIFFNLIIFIVFQLNSKFYCSFT